MGSNRQRCLYLPSKDAGKPWILEVSRALRRFGGYERRTYEVPSDDLFNLFSCEGT